MFEGVDTDGSMGVMGSGDEDSVDLAGADELAGIGEGGDTGNGVETGGVAIAEGGQADAGDGAGEDAFCMQGAHAAGADDAEADVRCGIWRGHEGCSVWPLEAALFKGFGEAGAIGYEAGEVGVDFRGGLDVDEVLGGLQPGENHVGNPAAGDALFAIAGWDVAGPEADVLLAVFGLGAEKDDGMAVLGIADLRGPEIFMKSPGLAEEKSVELGPRWSS